MGAALWDHLLSCQHQILHLFAVVTNALPLAQLAILDYLGSWFFSHIFHGFLIIWTSRFVSALLLRCLGTYVVRGHSRHPRPLIKDRVPCGSSRGCGTGVGERGDSNKALALDRSKSNQLSSVVWANTVSAAGWRRRAASIGRQGCGQINDVPLGSMTLSLSANEEGLASCNQCSCDDRVSAPWTDIHTWAGGETVTLNSTAVLTIWAWQSFVLKLGFSVKPCKA